MLAAVSATVMATPMNEVITNKEIPLVSKSVRQGGEMKRMKFCLTHTKEIAGSKARPERMATYVYDIMRCGLLLGDGDDRSLTEQTG